jgi:hypothetical protein
MKLASRAAPNGFRVASAGPDAARLRRFVRRCGLQSPESERAADFLIGTKLPRVTAPDLLTLRGCETALRAPCAKDRRKNARWPVHCFVRLLPSVVLRIGFHEEG